MNLDVDDTLLAATGGDGGLKIVNIANPQLPVVLDTIQSLHGIVEISITEQLVVLTGIDIIDISDPTSPDIIIEDWAPGELCGGERISLSDTFLHIAGYRVEYDEDYYSWDVGEYYCYNIADPESPEFVNYREFGDYSHAICVSGVGAKAFIGWTEDPNPFISIVSLSDDTILTPEGSGSYGLSYIDVTGKYWCYKRHNRLVVLDTLFSKLGHYDAVDLRGDLELARIDDSLYVLALGQLDATHCALYIIKHDTIFCQIGYLLSLIHI